MQQLKALSQCLEHISKSYQNPKALNSFENGRWQTYSTAEFLRDVQKLALALAKLGVKRGDRIGIIAVPSARWTIADLAIMSLGAVSVPLFANISEENFHFIISQTGVKITFIGGEACWTRYEANHRYFSMALSLDNVPGAKSAISYHEALAMGEEFEHLNPKFYANELAKTKSNDLATIIYTSGSTGVPKGAEHTHYSFLSLIHNDLYGWSATSDRYLNVLPLAHVYARSLNLILLAWGVSIYYYNDLKNLAAACREIKPTILVVVPRLLEKVYAKMIANLQHSPYLKKTIGQWAFDLANQEEESLWKKLFHPLADTLVYSHLRDALGGQLRVVLSGGAALNPHLYHFFLDIGIPVFEGWGLTEGCPFTVNRIGKVRVGTVGQPIGDVEVRIKPDGEVLIRASNVMRGYYNDPERTARFLDREGWLHTGDKGSIDADGYVTIIGRMKEQFKTSTGKLVVPVPIEQALCGAPLIEAALLIADKRRFVSCLLVPNLEVLHGLKKSHGGEQQSDEEFLNSPFIKEETQKLIDRVNEHLNHWEQIQAYRFIPHELTIDRGELTPSMKIVRDVVQEKYASLINAIYAEEPIRT
jgi:long-chain acyl-CoA synthetase